MTYALPPCHYRFGLFRDRKKEKMEKAEGESQDFVTSWFLTEKGRELLESLDPVSY